MMTADGGRRGRPETNSSLVRPDGLLLDLHPEPEKPSVDIVLAQRQQHLGWIDNSALIVNIHSARTALAGMLEAHLFAYEGALVFDVNSHFASVDEWLRHREARRATSIVEPAIIDRARALMSAQTESELLVSERVQATLLRRGNVGGIAA